MKKRTVLTVLGVIGVTCGVVVGAILCRGDRRPTALLSVGETVELACRLDRLSEEEWKTAEHRLNPAARPALRDILKDSTRAEDWVGVVLTFMVIGEGDDVEALVNFVRNQEGFLEGRREEVVVLVFHALGKMADRDVAEAREALKRMIHPDYWRGAKFSFYSTSRAPEPTPLEVQMADRALEGYSMSRDPDFPAVASAVLSSIHDAELRKQMEWRVQHAIDFYREDIRERGAKRGAVKGRPAKTGDQSPLGDTAGRAEPRSERTAAHEQQPVSDRPDDAAVLEEALRVYVGLCDAFIKGKYEQIVPNLADDGEPVVPAQRLTDKAIASYAEDMRKDTQSIELTRAVCNEANSLKAGYGPAEVTRTYVSVLEKDEQNNAWVKVRVTETVIVKVPYRESKAIAAKYIPAGSPTRDITTNADGDLVIYMIKKDGRWYWNPFGW